MQSRRRFIGTIAAPAALAATGAPLAALTRDRGSAAAIDPFRSSLPADVAARAAAHTGSAETVAGDEDFWFDVGRAFTVDRSMVNLNNGGVSPAPLLVQDAMKAHLDYMNKAPAYTMWAVLQPQKEGVRSRMALEWGVDPEEIAIVRNASEGLQICQQGFDLERGDEILTSSQDYPRMLTTFRQRVRREGVVLNEITLPVPSEDNGDIVSRFEKGITPRTRLILMSHMINITGQILPVREVVAMARARGIPVIVDGAHALAHNHFRISDLDCDYYATSLHKWLFAPIGTGLLYVRRNRIRDLWPLMAAPPEMNEDIRKFEETGTYPIANPLAIAEALTFHQGIGGERKAARLVYLRDYWAKRVTQRSNVRLHTSLKPGFACGIATMEIDGIDPNALAKWLFDKHHIIATPIIHPQFRGLRVAPSVYTTLNELDRFVAAIDRVAVKGLA